MSCRVAIADDLTGALEVAAKFAAHGLPARTITGITFTFDPAQNAVLLVIDTESRHVSAHEASARVEQIATWARDHVADLIYKKTDSTLRGNIAAEFNAIQRIFPGQSLVYAPAYPDLGRTVRDGKLFVHGTPVHQTAFANDPWWPVRDCRIRSVLGDVEVLVLDGERNEDVSAAAEFILREPPPRICAGSAALAGALARKIGSHVAEVELPRVAACLVVNGSLHPVSLQQIAKAKEAGIFDENWVLLDEAVEGSGRERALAVGERVRQLLNGRHFDALIVFGGDTAFGIHHALGGGAFEAIGEIAPGVAVSQLRDLLWITKAGGFGPPEILATIRRRLA